MLTRVFVSLALAVSVCFGTATAQAQDSPDGGVLPAQANGRTVVVMEPDPAPVPAAPQGIQACGIGDPCEALRFAEALRLAAVANQQTPATLVTRAPAAAPRPAVVRRVAPVVRRVQPACPPGDEACLCGRRNGLMLADAPGGAQRCRVGREVTEVFLAQVNAATARLDRVETATADTSRRLADFAERMPGLVLELVQCQSRPTTPNCESIMTRMRAAQNAAAGVTTAPNPATQSATPSP